MEAYCDTVFSPSFGNRPTSLVGREAIVNDFLNGLRTRPGSKERSTVILGQRGFGKTVLLWEFADRARQAGYAVATPTSVREGLVRRVAEKLEEDASGWISGNVPGKKVKLTGGTIGALGFSAGVQFSHGEGSGQSDEARLVSVCRALTEQGIGSLLLVDELQGNSPEVRNLVGTYQEMVGEGLDVAIVLAGVPASVSRVLNDHVLTFLNRARKVELGPLLTGDVDAFMMHAFKKCGVALTEEQRQDAAESSSGSPYLMQLIGHYVVLYADEDGKLSEEQFDSAIAAAQAEYLNDVCGTTLAPLSDNDIRYLVIMAQSDGSCRSADVAQGMGVTADYAQQYRRRLIEAGIVRSPRHGVVEFAVPLLAEYLKAQREEEEQAERSSHPAP